jgi:hypothetical protein
MRPSLCLPCDAQVGRGLPSYALVAWQDMFIFVRWLRRRILRMKEEDWFERENSCCCTMNLETNGKFEVDLSVD